MDTALIISGVSKSLCDWGVVGANLVRKNCAADSLNLRFSSAADTAGLSVGDSVELFQGGVRTFSGKILKLPLGESALDGTVELFAENAWSTMSEIIYQQLWQSADTASGEAVLSPVYRSKVVLGQNSDGVQIGVAAQLMDILEYAVSCGAEFCIGEISADAKMLLDEAKDLSCAECIRRVLKWLPNTLVYFDYSKEGLPAINIIMRQNALEGNLDGRVVKSLKYWARHDLEVSGVVIKYERENKAEDFSWITLEEDKYPPDFDAKQARALVMSVELAGSKSACQQNTIVCDPIDMDSSNWWSEHIPVLKEVYGLVIESWSRLYPELPRELVRGTVSSKLNYKTQRDRISATVRYTDSDGSSVRRKVAITLIATNAVSGTHTLWTQSQSVEETPTGLAEAVYSAASDLKYEGECTLVDARSSDFFARKLFLEENVSAPVICTEEDLSKSILRLKFGPPKHLYPDGIAELFRINRNRNAPASTTSRISGRGTSASTHIEGDTPDYTESHGTVRYERFVINCDSLDAKVDIDAGKLNKSDKAEFKEVYVCSDGFLAKAKVLMTEPEKV